MEEFFFFFNWCISVDCHLYHICNNKLDEVSVHAHVIPALFSVPQANICSQILNQIHYWRENAGHAEDSREKVRTTHWFVLKYLKRIDLFDWIVLFFKVVIPAQPWSTQRQLCWLWPTLLIFLLMTQNIWNECEHLNIHVYRLLHIELFICHSHEIHSKLLNLFLNCF